MFGSKSKTPEEGAHSAHITLTVLFWHAPPDLCVCLCANAGAWRAMLVALCDCCTAQPKMLSVMLLNHRFSTACPCTAAIFTQSRVERIARGRGRDGSQCGGAGGRWGRTGGHPTGCRCSDQGPYEQAGAPEQASCGPGDHGAHPTELGLAAVSHLLGVRHGRH